MGRSETDLMDKLLHLELKVRLAQLPEKDLTIYHF
jgi:hypothetical protein